jgi:hypothetical protein
LNVGSGRLLCCHILPVTDEVLFEWIGAVR